MYDYRPLAVRDAHYFSKVAATRNELECVLSVLYGLENHLGDLIGKPGQSRASPLGEPYKHVSSNYSLLIQQLKTAARVLKSLGIETHRLLDVGCGLGTKLYMASKLGWNVCGLEIRDEYIEIAQRLTQNCVLNIDAYDFDRYHEFDVIFYYDPVFDEAGLAKLEDMLFQRARRPSLIIKAAKRPPS